MEPLVKELVVQEPRLGFLYKITDCHGDICIAVWWEVTPCGFVDRSLCSGYFEQGGSRFPRDVATFLPDFTVSRLRRPFDLHISHLGNLISDSRFRL